MKLGNIKIKYIMKKKKEIKINTMMNGASERLYTRCAIKKLFQKRVNFVQFFDSN